MAEVDAITVKDAANTDRDVATLSKVIKTIGLPADAKASTSDATPVTWMQVLKQISFSIQAAAASLASLVTAIGSTAWDLGAGAIGSRTQRIVHASDDPVVAAISGSVADGAADSGNSSKIGYIAKTNLSGETLETAGDRIPAKAGLDGALFVRHVPLADIVSGTASNTDGTSTEVIATAGSGIKQYLTRVSLSNMHASTTVMVALKSGSTSKYRVAVPPGGREFAFDPPLPPNAADEAWNFDPDSAVTTIECSMVGFKSKV